MKSSNIQLLYEQRGLKLWILLFKTFSSLLLACLLDVYLQWNKINILTAKPTLLYDDQLYDVGRLKMFDGYLDLCLQKVTCFSSTFRDYTLTKCEFETLEKFSKKEILISQIHLLRKVYICNWYWSLSGHHNDYFL